MTERMFQEIIILATLLFGGLALRFTLTLTGQNWQTNPTTC